MFTNVIWRGGHLYLLSTQIIFTLELFLYDFYVLIVLATGHQIPANKSPPNDEKPKLNYY